MNKILFFSHDPLLNEMFAAGARESSCDIIIESDLQKGIEIIRSGQCQSVLACVPLMTERCPRRILKSIQEVNPYIPVFFILNDLDLALAISLTKLGVEYCYTRPFAVEMVLENIRKTLSGRIHPVILPQKDPVPRYFYASSEAATQLYAQIDTVADTNFKVIIYGETGTGKESVAKRLCKGIFKDRPFIAVDCGCLNRELAASELFGHKKGSFSGAFEDKTGAFEAADNGTIFLDEIGNLDYSVQILLLRAIEERKIKRIGSNTEIDINVRIIAASNERLSEAVEAGRFREDLYYRLNEFEINIPPLRERMEDLEPFINFFIWETNRDLNKNITGVSPALLKKFQAYSWPGNLRELKNVVRRGCLMAGREITADCMAEDFMEKLNAEYKGRAFHDKFTDTSPAYAVGDLKYKSVIAEYEEILKVLEEEKYNKSRTAQRLNINRKTLYNKISTYHKLMKSQRIL
ncbi:MAG: sigma-54-dependent Fis family transcriptional regulator [Leadbetterella sp.]|nr:sigma-54-dependent Fis family transcriptional regulator [Leadbetterella sp.]